MELKVICVKPIDRFESGQIYNACPVLSGYQVSFDREHSWEETSYVTTVSFLNEKFAKHFKVLREVLP